MRYKGPVGEVFGEHERARVAAALDEHVPGASALGAVEYVERLLTALDHDPPRVWAAPGAWAGVEHEWLALGPWERHAWQQRIDGWRALYQRLLAGSAQPGDERTLRAHAIEATYGDPAYGGNRAGGGWHRIAFPEPLFPPGRSAS